LRWASLSWIKVSRAVQIGAFEAKNTLGGLLDRVERGEEIIITRHGKPVARLGPCRPSADEAAARKVLDRIRLRARTLAAGPFDWTAPQTDRDAGRP
jgi:prevent-host-death family protein